MEDFKLLNSISFIKEDYFCLLEQKDYDNLIQILTLSQNDRDYDKLLQDQTIFYLYLMKNGFIKRSIADVKPFILFTEYFLNKAEEHYADKYNEITKIIIKLLPSHHI